MFTLLFFIVFVCLNEKMLSLRCGKGGQGKTHCSAKSRNLPPKINVLQTRGKRSCDSTKVRRKMPHGTLKERRQVDENSTNDRQSIQHGRTGRNEEASSVTIMSQKSVGLGSTRKRGHQHHPRNQGTRTPQTPQTPAVAKSGVSHNITQPTTTADQSLTAIKQQVIVSNSNESDNSNTTPLSALRNEALTDTNTISDTNVDIIDLTINTDELLDVSRKNDFVKSRKNRKPSKRTQLSKDMAAIYRPAAEGASQSDHEGEDPETEELARLRCTSERAEVVAEREIRRKGRRCADYPGLAFGSSIYSSDTMMKFSIIRNELLNIRNTQLRRVCVPD